MALQLMLGLWDLGHPAISWLDDEQAPASPEVLAMYTRFTPPLKESSKVAGIP